jgi:hypothetical protein
MFPADVLDFVGITSLTSSNLFAGWVNTHASFVILYIASFFVGLYLLMDKILLVNHLMKHKIYGMTLVWGILSLASYFIVGLPMALIYPPILVCSVIMFFIIVGAIFYAVYWVAKEFKPGLEVDGGDDIVRRRRPFSNDQKEKAMARQGFRCYYCDKPLDNKLLIEYHHKNRKNWDNSDGNCIATHTYCHQGLERLHRQ